MNKAYYEEVGNRIRTLRKDLDLSQSEFSKKIRYDQATISKAERGDIALSPLMRLVICQVFNVEEEWLLTGSGEMYGVELFPKKYHGLFDFDLMKEIIESVEEVLQKNGISLSPKKKADLIGLIYEQVVENEEIKSTLSDRVLKLAKLAS